MEKLEIFEAGTGHGALTLNLSRAIHGANRQPPKIPSNDAIFNKVTTTETGMDDNNQIARSSSIKEGDLQAWRDNRRAVVHTLDCSSNHSRHAERMIESFRDGIYYNNIDFHVGNINDYISDRLSKNGGVPFLDHAILDLPACHENMEILESALKSNGSLLVFCPSITQINTAVLHGKSKELHLYLETVLELGAGAGVGGREWDIRPVRTRAFLRTKEEEQILKRKGGEAEELGNFQAVKAGDSSEPIRDADGWELVCRPKVGLRIQGGGFVAQWRKMTVIQDVSDRRLTLSPNADRKEQAKG
jgi:tRNA (adenine57-N1/adenine58-N1)-methyltransferase